MGHFSELDGPLRCANYGLDMAYRREWCERELVWDLSWGELGYKTGVLQFARHSSR